MTLVWRFNPTKKNEQMEVRRERYDWLDVRCSFYECECRDTYVSHMVPYLME